MEMSSSAKKKYPHFFQVFLPEHSSKCLRLPYAFLEHLDHKLPKKVVLRNHHGNHWPVDVAKIDDCDYFGEGWCKFVSENSLQVGEFLIFEYNGHHIFDILILATTGCKKEQIVNSQSNGHPMQEVISLPTHEEEDESESSVGKKRYGCRGKNYSVIGYCEKKLGKDIKEFLPSNGNPFFITKLRRTRSGEVCIPHGVREDFGLRFSENIDLEDPKGRIWKGRIDLWKDGRCWVKGGWKQLCRWNSVAMDDWLICEFLPSAGPTCEVIKVQVIHSRDLSGKTNTHLS